jgi:myo-inositol-1(or 4)-monophosphatase
LAASEAAFSSADDLALLVDAAHGAGEVALRYFRGENRSWKKHGDSPVSEADIAVDAYLRKALTAARPAYGWLSEESEQIESAAGAPMFIIDPIDGTRGFLAGEPQWCVSAAVVVSGSPVAGVLFCPALDRCFAACAGGGATDNGAAIRPSATTSLRRITASRRVNAEIERLSRGRFEVMPYIPSLAYRLAMVATGEVDGAYARSGAHDWDLAAADLIIRESGGRIETIDGRQLRFGPHHRRAPALLAAAPGRFAALRSLAETGGFLQ